MTFKSPSTCDEINYDTRCEACAQFFGVHTTREWLCPSEVAGTHTPARREHPYGCLEDVLQRAYDQAATGKGAERHADGKPFDQQPMQQLIKLFGVGFALGQAAKKAQESQRMDKDAAVRELLGAINYLAGAVIALESRPSDE
jgi:hypothetical protein